jgi:hypothetical protein
MILPDFLIGAHTLVENLALHTRVRVGLVGPAL